MTRSTKTKVLRRAPLLLICFGAVILSYPLISNWLVSRNQTDAIRHYGLTVTGMNARRRQEEWEKAQEYNELLSGVGITDPFIPDSGYVLPEEYRSILNIDGVIGVITIPKINVNMPICHGTEEEVLKKGAGHLRNTAFPIGGAGTHAVLTAHRGLPSAKLFTDLDRLVLGDVFYITVMNERLAYQVDQILTVSPNDTKELLPSQGKDYITLITCTPYGVNSHRLFVRALRVEDGAGGGEAAALDKAVTLCLVLLILTMLAARLLPRLRRRLP